MGQFAPELILVNCDFPGKDQCLATLVDLLGIHGVIGDPVRFLTLIRERENEVSTGIGRGIGIPHARDTGVKELKTAVARLTQGIDFASLDGNPVRLVFMTAVPSSEPDAYRESLGRLSGFLRSPDNRERLLTAPDANNLYEILKEVGI